MKNLSLKLVCCWVALIGVLAAHDARAQTISANPQNVTVEKGAAQGSTLVTWDAGGSLKNLGAKLWQQIDGGEETLLSASSKGSRSIAIKAGETRVFRLYNFLKTKQLASVTVRAVGEVVNANAANADDEDDAGKDDEKPEDDAAASVSFTGTWRTTTRYLSRFTVILKQTGNQVTGTYSPQNGKIFNGVVVGRKLTFKWIQDNGYEGNGEFVMNEDGKGFTGTRVTIAPKPSTAGWKTYTPPPSSFAGKWDTTYGQSPRALVLEQNGDKVTGTFTPGNGKIDGTVDGKVLRFKWTSESSTGSGRFVMNAGDQSFSGSYNKGDNPDDVDGTWSGARHVASFAGNWKGVFSKTGSTMTMTLQQTGDVVTGSWSFDNKDGSPGLRYELREGKVVDNTLTFKSLWPGEGIAGSAELVMDEDGKTCKGNVISNPIVATRVGAGG